MSVNGVASTARSAPFVGGAPSTPAPSDSSLLPAGAEATLGQLQSSMAALYLVMTKLRDNQLLASRSQVNSSEQLRNAAEEERKAAIERARRAAEDDGGLFGWLSDDIGLAGAVGLVTFNYALVAADVAAHKLDILDNVKIDIVDIGAAATGRWEVLAGDVLLRKLDIAPEEARNLLERVGIPKDAPGLSDEDIKPVAKKLLIANLAIAGLTATVLSGGTTAGICIALAGVAVSAAGQQLAQSDLLDPMLGKGASRWIGIGLQVAGAATAVAAGNSKAAATVIKGATALATGTDTAVSAIQTSRIDDANIEVESARMALAKLDRFLDLVVDGMKESQSSHRKAAETLQGAIQTVDETQLALTHGIRA